MSAPIFK